MDRWPTGFTVQLLSLVVAACTSATPTQPPQGTPPAATASPRGTPASLAPESPQAGLLLSEVRFAPTAGDPAFIEISNASANPIGLGGMSLSLDTAMLSLQSLAAPVPSGGVALVLLDGQDSAGGLTLHASAGFALEADSGAVELLDRTGVRLDRVAWGGAADAVPLTNGALIPDVVEPGLSIGRAPGLTTPRQPLDWVVFEPAEVTPGAVNGLPAPAVLLPFIGGILDTDGSTLSWYPVSGAVSYRVEIQAEGAPSPEPAIEVTAESVDINVGARPAGAYGWTVTAIAADGSASLTSEVSQFEILPAPVAITLAAFTNTPGAQLQVPILSQSKDTAMLLLEQNVESGPHAWDVAHPGFYVQDPADNKNCAVASIAMANHFFGGDLSQDRIGFELFKDREPGPEGDLIYGYGIPSDKVTQLLTYALGTANTHLEPGQTPDAVWSAATASIDAGSPVLAAGLTHTIVLTGYSVVSGKRTLSYNDPWTASAGRLNIDAGAGAGAAVLDLWLPAAGSVGRMQEPGVTQDSDGDGVVDFDEVERFHTDASRPDSDGDKVRDKQDIASRVFDPQYGYAAARMPNGGDFDSDGRVTELDPDSDDGGCTDGEEDTNFDGHRNGSETWNFDAADDQEARAQDLCTRPSYVGGTITWTAVTTLGVSDPLVVVTVSGTAELVLLAEKSYGFTAERGTGSTYSYDYQVSGCTATHQTGTLETAAQAHEPEFHIALALIQGAPGQDLSIALNFNDEYEATCDDYTSVHGVFETFPGCGPPDGWVTATFDGVENYVIDCDTTTNVTGLTRTGHVSGTLHPIGLPPPTP